MSFVKTLATLAVGFAAARGVQKYQQMGGLEGVKGALRKAGEEGGVADQMGDFAEKLGVKGGRETMRDLFARFGTEAADATEATEAGMNSLLGAMTAAAQTGAKGLGDMLHSVSKGLPVNAMMEDQARLMIRAMIQAAKADGVIDADERTKILDHLSDASDEEIAFVEKELKAPVDIEGLVKDVSQHARTQVYSAALMAITVDSEAEKSYLRSLATALGLSAEQVAKIHSAMNKPPV